MHPSPLGVTLHILSFSYTVPARPRSYTPAHGPCVESPMDKGTWARHAPSVRLSTLDLQQTTVQELPLFAISFSISYRWRGDRVFGRLRSRRTGRGGENGAGQTCYLQFVCGMEPNVPRSVGVALQARFIISITRSGSLQKSNLSFEAEMRKSSRWPWR